MALAKYHTSDTDKNHKVKIGSLEHGDRARAGNAETRDSFFGGDKWIIVQPAIETLVALDGIGETFGNGERPGFYSPNNRPGTWGWAIKNRRTGRIAYCGERNIEQAVEDGHIEKMRPLKSLDENEKRAKILEHVNRFGYAPTNKRPKDNR